MSETTQNNQNPSLSFFTRAKANFSAFDFKIRSGLVRYITGKAKLERMIERKDKHYLHIAVETLHENLRKYCDDAMHQAVTKCPQDMLAQLIAKNEFLSESQKARIADILDTPNVSSNTIYIG